MLLDGKRGLIMGLANDKSIAWSVAQAVRQHGARLALTYQGDILEKRVRPLAETLGAELCLACDVGSDASIAELFETLQARWGSLDFLVHAIAFADREELKGPYFNTSRDNFRHSLDISCYSLTALCRAAVPLMTEGGTVLTLTYQGSQRVMPHYNVMGVAKAALEASVRYLAYDLGPRNIRVNALSAGPVRTLAASAIGDFRRMLKWNEINSPLRRNVSAPQLGGGALYLLSDLSAGTTGHVLYVDSGYHLVGMIDLANAAENAALLTDRGA